MSDNTNENENKTHKDIDQATGVETTGHEWDGLKELNNPLPRWWVWVWLITIVWSVWYWVVYPTWPTFDGATKGTSGYTQFKELAESQQEIIDRQRVYLEKFEGASLDEIRNDKELYAFAIAGGASAFKDNCATCHGSGATGSKGYPNLNDDDWIWGGTMDAIYETLQYGIRGKHEDTRISQMPAFGKDELLSPTEIDSVVDYVLSLSGGKKHANYVQGATIFEEQCASCHGDDGRGLQDYGAPNLADKIWLYGGDRDAVYQSVYSARAGVMPAWENRLSDNTLKQLTIYLHQLGGGEEEPADVQEETVPDEQ